MVNERYPGERRGLRLFLEELLPAAEAAGPAHRFLAGAIRRGLGDGDLGRLRHARQIFNNLPRGERQALSAAMLEARSRPPAAAAASERTRAERAPAARERSGSLVVLFETGREDGTEDRPRPEVRRAPAMPAPVCVAIEAGTLPSVAAAALRSVASAIEGDRRLLSARFWEEGDGEGRASALGDKRDVL